MSERTSTDQGSTRIALIAMTLAGSVILVDQTAVPLATPHIVDGLHSTTAYAQWILTANLLPLAAFMVVGGRLGDLFGLRKVFLIGTAGFLLATVLAATAQDMPMMIAARAVQGTAAALMMPNSVAIISSVFPDAKRGTALGVLAGGTAFFASLGPIVGGALTELDWRYIFVFNGLLTVAVGWLTVVGVPRIPESKGQRIDIAGVVTFTIAMAGLVFGLSQLAQPGASFAMEFVPMVIGAVSLAIFVIVELRVESPLIELRLLRHMNFLASNISQLISGAIELGLGFLLPFQLLLVIGVTPAVAGLALLPASIPIILVGPLSGKAYDRWGGRWPLTVGFLALAASGIALAVGVSDATVAALIPGLVLQGIGLGIVLTVNDPVGLGAVPADSGGEAAGMINTSEQLGGAIGIAAFVGIEYQHYLSDSLQRMAAQGIHPTPEQMHGGKQYILKVEQEGVHHVAQPQYVEKVFNDLTAAHVDGFRLAFEASASVALLGAIICFCLVRKGDPIGFPIRSRRSRWILAYRGSSDQSQ